MINKHTSHVGVIQISDRNQMRGHTTRLISALLAVLAVLAWSYWPIIADLFKEWQRNDDYSAGQLVPLVALFLLWVERKELRQCVIKPCWWGGIVLLSVAVAGKAYGLLFMFQSAERYSLVLTIWALVLFMAGWQVFFRAGWILLYLLLMVPFPGKIHNMISGPLQRIATTGSVFFLEAFGVRVSQQGNVIVLNQTITMSVVEACSGLRMLTAFIIVAGFIAYMVKRSRVQKAIVFLSSIPVAVLCNIFRISVTAVLFLVANTELAEKFFHDFAGVVMMPAAVILMFGELWLMDKLIESE